MSHPAKWLCAFIIGLLLSACSSEQAALAPPAAQELTGSEIGHYCGMLVADHSGPKGQIFVQGKEQAYWFSSVSDTFSFTCLPEEPKHITAIYVNDMGQTSWDKPEPGSWIEARKAWFVIGSDAISGMGGAEIAPFGQRQQAEAFVQQHGGKIVRFADISADQVLGQGMNKPAAPMPTMNHDQHSMMDHSKP